MTGSCNHNGMQFTTKDRDNDRWSVTVLHTIKEHGVTAMFAVTPVSMVFTVMIKITIKVSYGMVSMLLHQVGAHFAIQR